MENNPYMDPILSLFYTTMEKYDLIYINMTKNGMKPNLIIKPEKPAGNTRSRKPVKMSD